MGVVYKAEDVRLHRAVALKLLPDAIAHDPAALARFRREAEAASALNHPGICTVYDVGEAAGTAFIVMEYLDGLPLDVLIKRGPLPIPQLLSIARDIGDALNAAHRAGVLHRDVKPSNIFVTAQGRSKLLDFGIARFMPRDGEAAATVTSLTGVGAAVGTVAYMSPEQIRGLDVDGRADLFSLGAVLYEMATGRRAFPGDTPRPGVRGRPQPYADGGDHGASVAAPGPRSDPRQGAREGPQSLVLDIDTNVSFSPGGDRLVYARGNNPVLGRMSLLMANADGSGERALLSLPINGAYRSAPGWSPDGQLIAYTQSYTGAALGRLDVYDLRTGQSRLVFSSADIMPTEPQWSGDGRTLLVLYGTRRTALAQHQIGAIAYPSGAFRTWTNDTNDYAAGALSRDRATLVTVQSRTLNRIDLLTVGANEAAARQLLSVRETIRGLRWSATGEIVYALGGRIVGRRPEGRERTILAGTDASRLVSGGRRLFAPACSPDGQWVAFNAIPQVMRVPMSGGTPEPLGNFVGLGGLAYAPDGRSLALIADVHVPGSAGPGRKLVLITPRAAPQYRDLADNYSGGAVRFTDNGSAVAYVAVPPSASSRSRSTDRRFACWRRFPAAASRTSTGRLIGPASRRSGSTAIPTSSS